MAALALCRTAVNKIPTRIPIIGFENIVSILMNVSFVLKGETAPLICCIPVIKIAKPSMIFPTFLCVVRFPNVFKQIPINANNVVIVAVENKHNIQPVILVPILAPIIIPIACLSFIIPELTKPMTITVVALLD